jgi:hypothetical protein
MGFLDRFRRRPQEREERFAKADFTDDPDRALYVHLALDGGIFVIRGRTGEQLWVDREALKTEVERLKERGGILLYSREAGESDPPAHVEETFELIVGLEPPAIQLVEEPHPQALVPPEERQTITRP